MSKLDCVVMIISMIFLHIVDDFYLQGILAKLKQKSWWEENYPGKKYKSDYIMALYLHGMSWSTMIHIPIIAMAYLHGYENGNYIFITWILNALLHAWVDNEKCNKMYISLSDDQRMHIMQIGILAVIYVFLIGP